MNHVTEANNDNIARYLLCVLDLECDRFNADRCLDVKTAAARLSSFGLHVVSCIQGMPGMSTYRIAYPAYPAYFETGEFDYRVESIKAYFPWSFAGGEYDGPWARR